MLDWLFGRKKNDDDEKKKKPKSGGDAQDVTQMQNRNGSPLWKTSLLDFVDYHCVVFDNEEENKFEYTTIHNVKRLFIKKFKELVASLFDGMMQEVGLDNEKLAQLLAKGFQSKHKKIFNQLLFADDFLKFKQLMVNRNKTLQAEAIKALHQQQNPGSTKQEVKASRAERMTQQEILKQSAMEEEARQRKLQMQEEEELRKALEMSKIQAQEEDMIKNSHVKASQREQAKRPEPEHKSQNRHHTKAASPYVEQCVPPPQQQKQQSPHKGKELPPVKGGKQAQMEPLPPLKQTKKYEEPPRYEVQEDKRPEPVVEESKPEPQPVAEKTEQESQQDRKRRLMQQREKIRRKKEEERKKQLDQQEHKPPSQTILLQEDGIHETQVGGFTEEKKVSNEELQRRRELMKKIKNRIVDDF